MKTGWLRHGVVEIIKMAVIKDKNLFEMLESAGPALFHSKFGTNQDAQGTQIETLSKRILAATMRSELPCGSCISLSCMSVSCSWASR